jgi:hypothetical protein
MRVEVWIDDKSHEYLINLVAQEYYSESWEFIQRLSKDIRLALINMVGEIIAEEVMKN